MKTRAVIHGLTATVLVAIVLTDEGRPGSAPHTQPCGHQGHCLCVPNVRNYGYYTTQWRRWPTEVRRDEHFPESLGRERIPTPPGDPTEPLPIQRVPSRPVPGVGDFPIPDDILPPEGPFQPGLPILPEPAIPGGIPPFIPSTTPRSLPATDVPGPPSKAENPFPFEEPAEPEDPGVLQGILPGSGIPGLPSKPDGPAPLEQPAEPEAPQGSLHREPSPSPGISTSQAESEAVAVEPDRRLPLRQPDAWTIDARRQFDALRHQRPIRRDGAVRSVAHVSTPERSPQPDEPGPATSVDRPSKPDSPPMLDGFCPVTLSGSGQWRQGRPEYVAVYQDQLFHMAGPEERKQFLAGPHRFAPMFGGIDPVLVVEQQRWTPGSTQFCATYKGRIYMLSSKANLERFQANPRRYAFELDE